MFASPVEDSYPISDILALEKEEKKGNRAHLCEFDFIQRLLSDGESRRRIQPRSAHKQAEAY